MAQKKNPVPHASKESAWTNPDLGARVLCVNYMEYYLEATGLGSYRHTRPYKTQFEYYGKIQIAQ